MRSVGGRKHGTVRTTVSVPKDLKERMNQYEQEHYVNWSGLFAKAIEREINGAKLKKTGR